MARAQVPRAVAQRLDRDHRSDRRPRVGVAAAPAALSDPTGAEPDPVFILVMAAGLGLAMGALLGVGQALVLRHHVRHPWRWVSISAAAWPPAMVVIFTGAPVPDESWPTAPIIVLGALTGVVAGAHPGSRDHRTDADVDRSVGRLWCRGVVAASGYPGPGTNLRTAPSAGRKSGRLLEFPVQYARERDIVVVFPGGARRKNWWRNLRQPAELRVWIDGAWAAATGQAITAADAGYTEAHSIYGRRWPRIRVQAGGADPHPPGFNRFNPVVRVGRARRRGSGCWWTPPPTGFR